MTEPELLQRVLDECKKRGLFVHHFDAARRRPADVTLGFPDLVIAGPHGTLFRELKTQTAYPSDTQEKWLAVLSSGSQDARVWRPEHLHSGEIAAQLDAIA